MRRNGSETAVRGHGLVLRDLLGGRRRQRAPGLVLVHPSPPPSARQRRVPVSFSGRLLPAAGGRLCTPCSPVAARPRTFAPLPVVLSAPHPRRLLRAVSRASWSRLAQLYRETRNVLRGLLRRRTALSAAGQSLCHASGALAAAPLTFVRLPCFHEPGADGCSPRAWALPARLHVLTFPRSLFR